MSSEMMKRDAHKRGHRLNLGRLPLERHILSGLEVLIVANLIRTMLHLTLDNILLLRLFPAPPVSSRASLRAAAIVGPAAQSRPFG
jgi:hypothetical protein